MTSTTTPDLYQEAIDSLARYLSTLSPDRDRKVKRSFQVYVDGRPWLVTIERRP
jgi:hypothetical protein